MSDGAVKFKATVLGKLFVAIDAANLELSVKDMYVHPRDLAAPWIGTDPEELAWAVDYRRLKYFFETSSRLMQITFYSPRFDTKSHDGFLTVLKDAGYEIATKPVKQFSQMDGLPVLDQYFDIVDFRHEVLRLKKPKTPREAGFGS